MDHPFGPLISQNSEILILGSFPSPVSRQEGFYYGHPHNRFWPLLAAVYNVPTPITIDEKRNLILEHRLALYDAIASCLPLSASDAELRKAVPADIAALIRGTKIRLVLCNGAKAYAVYGRSPVSGIPFSRLPSTSPANAAVSFQELVNAWGKALK